MNGNTRVSLTLTLNNQARQGLRQMTQEQLAQSRRVTESIRQQVQQIRDGNAQRQLGIRTEQQIRAEIAQVQRAYDHLRTSGRASANDITRAQAALVEQTRRLNRELGVTEQTQTRLQRLQRAGAGAAAVAGGAVAAGMVAKGPLDQAREYDKQLTYLATTVTEQGASAGQYRGNKAALAQMVREALAKGGGTREDVTAALNKLVGSGKFNMSNAREALMTTAFNATATGATAENAAALTVQMKEFGIKDNELQLGHDIAAKGGKMGSFEYASQAEYLSKQLALAKPAGYYGIEGFKEIVKLNQLAMTTAGTKDEAGNNVLNFLQKLSSAEFKKSMADAVTVRRGDPTMSDGKKEPSQVFDWTTYVQGEVGKGVKPHEAFIQVLDRQLEDNKSYMRLRAEAQQADTPEKRKVALEAMSQIAVGSEIGRLIADRQALLGVMGAYYNKPRAAELDKGFSQAAGVNAEDHANVAEEEWYKNQQRQQEMLNANTTAYNAVSGALATVNGSLAEFAQKFPATAGVLYGGGVAVMAMAAGAGVAGTALWALSRAAAAAGLSMGGTVGGVLPSAATLKNAGLVGTVGAISYGAATLIRAGYMKTEAGQSFDNAIGSGITHVLAAFGNDTAQAALEAQQKYDKMINQNDQLIAEMRKANSKGPPMINLDMSAVASAVSERQDTDAKRGWRMVP